MKKKIVLGTIIGILVVILAVMITLVVVKNAKGKDNNKDKTKTEINSEYKPLAEEFAEALKDKEKMEEFAENQIDYKAKYAMEKVDELEDATDEEKKETFDKYYKTPDEKEYKITKDTWYNVHVSSILPDADLKLKGIKEYTTINFLENPYIEVTYELEGKDVVFSFEMYKDKIFSIVWPAGLSDTVDYDDINPFSFTSYNKMEISDDFSCLNIDGVDIYYDYKYDGDKYDPQNNYAKNSTETTLKNGVVINVSKNYMGYSEEIDFKYLVEDDTVEDPLDKISEVIGVFLYYEFEDTEEIKDKLTDLMVESYDSFYYDDELPFPQDMYDEYIIINHVRFRLKTIAVSEKQTEVHIILTPDKEENK